MEIPLQPLAQGRSPRNRQSPGLSGSRQPTKLAHHLRLRTAREVRTPPLAVVPAKVHNPAPAAVRQPVNRAFTLRPARAHDADGPSVKRRTDASDTRRDRPIFTESSCSA